MTNIIRTAVPEDIKAIRHVQKITWLATYPNSDFGISIKDIESKFPQENSPEEMTQIKRIAQRYQDKNTKTWVAENQDKTIIGFCVATKKQDHNQISAIYVLPSQQRRGVGQLLMKKALDWFDSQKQVSLNVVSYNQNAITFYHKFGFKKTGVQGSLDTASQLPSGVILPEIEMKIEFSSAH